MADTIRFKRGSKANLPASAAEGEPLFTTDSRQLFVGMGPGKEPVPVGGATTSSFIPVVTADPVNPAVGQIWIRSDLAVDAAPVASNVAFSGTLAIGQTLTGSYTYSDFEGDVQGVSTFRWLRNDVAITGATANTRVVAEADVGTTLKFEVTPVALTGTSPGISVASSGTLIPMPAPPAILVGQGNTQNTISFTENSSFATETYNLYWATTTGVTKANGTKIAGVTSPYVHTGLTNGTAYYYVLTMVINGVESVESAQVSATPSANASPTISSFLVQNASTSSIQLQAIIADTDNTVPTDITEVTIELYSDAGYTSLAYSKVLTIAGDIALFHGAEDWYTWTATFAAGTYYRRAKAKDIGSGSYGSWYNGGAFTIISKTASGKIFEWNGTDLTQFPTQDVAGGTVSVSGGVIVFNDTNTGDDVLIQNTALTLPTDKFEFQYESRQVGASSSSVMLVNGTGATAQISTINGTDEVRWKTYSTAEVIEAYGSDITNVWILGKIFVELDAVTPANNQATVIINGTAKTPLVDSSLSALQFVQLKTGVSSSGQSDMRAIVVSKNRYVTVSGLSTGQKARIGAVVAIESGGTATIDGASIKWGSGLTIEVLDSGDNVLSSLTPSDGIHGGDTYSVA